MRHIVKQKADQKLVNRHQKPPATEQEATTAWENFRGERRRRTRDKCLAEQYGLCGYSEIDLEESGLGMHLEHVEPKHRNPSRTFDHHNLILSAIDDIKNRDIDRLDVFGGHAKLRWYHAEAFIHPLLPNCQDYFHYETSGRIIPKAKLPRRERAKVRLTIYRLNLNAPILVNERRTRLAAIDVLIHELRDNQHALRRLAEKELLPVNGRLRPFHSALRQVFGRLGDDIQY